MLWIGVSLASMMAAMSIQAAESFNIRLTVEERLGVGRLNEPVTSGVPLPMGVLKDVSRLVLLDSNGKPVPAQFGVATRWWEDGSVKWVHVDFPASVPAGGIATFTLGVGEAAKPATPLVTRKTAAGYEVITGPLRFTVKEKGFNLFDEVWLNGKPLIASHKDGILLKAADGDYSPGWFPGTTISVEEQGPMKLVLLVAGQNVKADGTGYAMDYKCRIYAYANCPTVRVVYTVENRRGKWSEHVDLADWRIDIPTALGKRGPALFGMGKTPVPAPLDGPDVSARVEVLATDLCRLQTGSVTSESNPHKEDSPWLGTLSLAGENGGVLVGVKNFWQMWAKYLAADGTGGMTVGLWTDRVRDKGITTFVDKEGRAQFFAGVGRTHEIFFHFHDGKSADPIAALAPVREPLFARCEPAWYCQGTKVFGDLSEASPDVYRPEWRDKVAALNKWAEQSVTTPLQRWRTVKAGVNGAVDSYGMLNYGDGVEEHNDGLEPEKIHWEGGYYDYMHSIHLNFARTGDLKYLWLANDMSRHNEEVHHTHHDQYPGRSRYCPSYAHIIMDGGSYYASGTFNHWKNLSIFERWYLLGDHRAREAGMETLKFALSLGNDGIDFGQPRSLCHGILGMWAGYEATGDKKYLEAMGRFAKAVAARIDKGVKMGSGGWQRGMALQGLCWYVEKTGDESVVPAIITAMDRDFNDGAAELAYAAAFLWKRSGEPRYFQKATRYLGGKADIWMQRFGNNGRSKLYVPTLVRQDSPRQPPPDAKAP